MYSLVIVDDDELIRKGLEKVIEWENLGFKVTEVFSNARDALTFFEDNVADVILTDIIMPEMGGLELLDEVRKLKPDVKSVIISGYNDFEFARTAIKLRVEEYLLKPLSQNDIEKVFHKIRKKLDEENASSQLDKKKKLKDEYELMRILSSRVNIDTVFMELLGKEKFCELIVIKVDKNPELVVEGEQVQHSHSQILKILSMHFYCHVNKLYVALISPKQLNGILMQLKHELGSISGLVYKVAIGREVYMTSEVITSYWSALELIRDDGESTIVHYERQWNKYKRDWDTVQEIQQRLIVAMESGQEEEIGQHIEAINKILKKYGSLDIYYFYSNILMRLLRYFKIQRMANFILPNDQGPGHVEKTPDVICKEFCQDIQFLQKILRDHSDSMQNIMSNKARKLIDERYAQCDLSLAALANELNVSYGYLSTIFKKSIGKSFKEYLVDVRMEKARELVMSRDYKVYEISEMVGYNNPRYFTDAFKKYFSYSPLEYISRFRGGE